MRRALAGIAAVLGLALGQQQVTLFWSGAITGPTSDAGAPYGAAVEDYCEYANERKLIPGVVFNCVVRDDQYNNANTQRFFEEAVDRFKIPVFLSYATGANLQLKPLIQELKIPTIPASMHIELIDPPNNDYIFLPTTSYSEQVVALLEYIARQKKGAKVALVVHPSPSAGPRWRTRGRRPGSLGSKSWTSRRWEAATWTTPPSSSGWSRPGWSTWSTRTWQAPWPTSSRTPSAWA